jgi:hypothetical protein
MFSFGVMHMSILNPDDTRHQNGGVTGRLVPMPHFTG